MSSSESDTPTDTENDTDIDPTSKSERTRAHLRELALESFRTRGYDATTMRLLATEAGVSVGTTNYHFASKVDLVQELYLDVQERHRAAAGPLLQDETDLVARLKIVYSTGLDQMQPYHAHAAEFVSAALAPNSPINPLSVESSPARGITEALFAEAVEGARASLPDRIAAELPRVLFVAHLLLALYWAYDDSPRQKRTRTLLSRGLSLLKIGLPLTRLPLLRRPMADLLALMGDVRS